MQQKDSRTLFPFSKRQGKTYEKPRIVGKLVQHSESIGKVPAGIYSAQSVPAHEFRCILVDNRKTQPHFFKNAKPLIKSKPEIKESSIKSASPDSLKFSKGKSQNPSELTHFEIPLVYKPLTLKNNGNLYGYDCLLSCATVDINSSNDKLDIPRRIVDYSKTQPHFFKGMPIAEQQKAEPISQSAVPAFRNDFNLVQSHSHDIDTMDSSSDMIPDIPLRLAHFTSTDSQFKNSTKQNDWLCRTIDTPKLQSHFYTNTKLLPYQERKGGLHNASQLPIQRELSAYASTDLPDSMHSRYKNQNYTAPNENKNFNKNYYSDVPEQKYEYISSLEYFQLYSKDILKMRNDFQPLYKKNKSHIKNKEKVIPLHLLQNVKIGLNVSLFDEEDLFLLDRSHSSFIDIPKRYIDMTRKQPQFYFPDFQRLSELFENKIKNSEEVSRLVSADSNYDEVNIPNIPRVYLRPEYLQPWFFTALKVS